MARPKGKTPERVHISARVLKVIADEFTELTSARNPNRSQAIEDAMRRFLPALRKMKQSKSDR